MQLSGYHVKNIIGQGGMATVYRAEHVLLKQERALKVMSPDLTSQLGFKESFIREGQIVATLKHPNIIALYDIDERDGFYFMAMEYLRGGNLKELLDLSSLSLAEALPILEQVGGALHHAHQQNLIHRDIKPANILFSSEGDAVLTDFGISKLQGTESDLTRQGYGLVGTLRYMSPEQVEGKALDHRSDLYSLALVFYEMLSGKCAIKATSAAAIVHEHIVATPPQLPDAFAFLQTVLDKALAKTADERYADIPAFIHAVKVAEHKQRFSKRLRLFRPLILLLVCASVVAGWMMGYPQQWQYLFEVKESKVEKALLENIQPIPPSVLPMVPEIKTEQEEAATKKREEVAKKKREEAEKKKREKAVEKKQAEAEKKKREEAAEKKQVEAENKEREEAAEKKQAEAEEKKWEEAAEKKQAEIEKKKREEAAEKKREAEKKKREENIEKTNSKSVIKFIRTAPYTYLYAEVGIRKLGQMKQNEKLNVIGTVESADGKNWSKVEFNGRQGYVKSSHLKDTR